MIMKLVHEIYSKGYIVALKDSAERAAPAGRQAEIVLLRVKNVMVFHVQMLQW